MSSRDVGLLDRERVKTRRRVRVNPNFENVVRKPCRAFFFFGCKNSERQSEERFVEKGAEGVRKTPAKGGRARARCGLCATAVSSEEATLYPAADKPVILSRQVVEFSEEGLGGKKTALFSLTNIVVDLGKEGSNRKKQWGFFDGGPLRSRLG